MWIDMHRSFNMDETFLRYVALLQHHDAVLDFRDPSYVMK